MGNLRNVFYGATETAAITGDKMVNPNRDSSIMPGLRKISEHDYARYALEFAATEIAAKHELSRAGKALRERFSIASDSSAQYSGKILAVSHIFAAQEGPDDSILMHVQARLDRELQPGEEVAIRYDHGRGHVAGKSQQKGTERKGLTESELSQQAATDVAQMIGTVQAANSEKGRYVGPIKAVFSHHLVQDIGRQTAVIHETKNLAEVPTVGQNVNISYANGRASVQHKEQGKGRGNAR